MAKLSLDDFLDKDYRVDKLHLLIDGDVYAYKAASVTDGRMYQVDQSLFKYKKDADAYVAKHGGEITVMYQPEPLKNCIQSLRLMIEFIESALRHKSDNLVKHVFTTGSANFRADILDHYKWNRLSVDEVIKRCDGDEEKARTILRMRPATFEKNKGVVPRKPYHLSKAKSFLAKKMGAIQIDPYEADDLIGLEADRLRRLGEDFVVVSIDKDLNCIPGWHYNSDRDEVYHVSDEEALYNFYYQCCLGDKTDNIPGIPGVGEGGAKKIMKACKDRTNEGYYRHILNHWEDKFPGEGESNMLKSAQCLWILQNSEGKSVEEKLWQPPEMSKIDKTEDKK